MNIENPPNSNITLCLLSTVDQTKDWSSELARSTEDHAMETKQLKNQNI